MNRLYFACACVSFLSMAFMLTSCMEELENTDKIGGINFEPELGFPLVNSTFTMGDFLTKGGSKAQISEQSGVMVLIYDDSISTPEVGTIFEIPDQQSPTISITGSGVSFPSPGGSVTVSKNITFAFDPSPGDNLDSVLLKTGQMLFSLTSTFPANVDLDISIPSLQQQGAGLQQNVSFNGPGTVSPTIDLERATLDLTANGTTTNTITFAITATITDTGQPISSTDKLDCSFGMKDLRFGGLFGNISTKTLALESDSIDVDIFGDNAGGGIELLSPAVRLDVGNSFGLPVGFDIQHMAVIQQDSSTVQLTGSAASAPTNPYLINGPSYSQVGQSVSTQIDINADNSNIGQLFLSLPYFLEYRFGVVFDPPDNVQNFVLDTSKITIGVHLELPFHGKISGLSITKEYEFDGLGIDDAGESVVRIKTINELPLDAAIQVYFVDASGAVLDSLFANPSIIKGAQVDADGFSQDNAELTKDVPILQAKVDRINDAEELLVRAEMQTTNEGSVPVKFSLEDQLSISIGLRTKVGYKLN